MNLSGIVLLVQVRTVGRCILAALSSRPATSEVPALEHLFNVLHPILRNDLAHHFLIPFPISSVAVCPSPYPKFFISSGAIRPLSMRQLR